LVCKDLLVPLVTMVSPEKWDLRVSRVCPDLKDPEDPREMVDRLVRMEFQEMLVRLVTLDFLASLDCPDLSVPLELVVLMEPRETLDPPVLKASKVFQVLRDLLVNLVKRVLREPPENLVPLDVPEPVESVVTQEKEDLLESKDPKVRPVPLVLLALRVLLVSLETREKLVRLVLRVFKDCLD